VFRFGNINVPQRNITNVSRGGAHHLAMNFGGAVEFYGYNVLEVSEEVMHCSSVEIEDGATVLCRKMSTSDTSMFYFYEGTNLTAGIAYTRGAGFRVGNGSVFVSYNDQGGTTFPCIYYRYGFLEVGENATFAATMTGNAFRRQDIAATTHFTVGSGSVVNLTSLSAGTATFEVNGGAPFRFESAPGAEIYIVGNRTGTGPVINYAAGGTAASPKSFIVNAPKFFDFRNKGQENTTVYSGAAYCTFRVNNSDIDIWYTRAYAGAGNYAPHAGSANLYVMDAAYYQVGGSSADTVASSEPDLAPMQRDRYTRIAGGKDRYPEVMFEFEEDPLLNNPTDADKFVRVRAILAWTPDDNGVYQDGNVGMIPIYAPPNQVKVWLSSEDGNPESSDYSGLTGAVQFLDPVDGKNKWFLPVDANGYLLLPPGYPSRKLGEFLKAGTLLSAKALRHNAAFTKTRLGEEFTARVTDVTPPAPAEINGIIMRGQAAISGRNGEPDAKVTIYVNGTIVPGATAVVDGAGNWKIEGLDSLGVNLVTGDKVRIYMEDGLGNKNPIANVNYHDATFLKASEYVVQELPAQLHVRQIVLADERNRFVPETGYVTALKRGRADATLEAVNMFVNSGTDELTTGYTCFTYPPMALGNILLEATNPQYYEYIGYQITGAESLQTPGAVTPGNIPPIPVDAQTEKWITLYVAPRTNGTAYYSRDTVDNGFGEVHLQVKPAMSLFARNTTVGEDIGYISNKSTIRIPSQLAAQTITVTADAWGDGIANGNINWTRVSGLTSLALTPQSPPRKLDITIPPTVTSGSVTVRATSAHNPGLYMDFTIQVIDLIVRNTENDVEMTPNYTMYVDSSPAAPTVLNFTASKGVNWGITSQTGVHATLSGASGAANILTIPANYRGTVNIRVTSGATIRNFRVVVRR